ncbi:MAG: hypothetical protein ACJZ8R_00045 [Pseudohongiellaceae bacterium]
MIKRLGLVIHWLGFLCFIFVVVSLGIAYFNNEDSTLISVTAVYIYYLFDEDLYDTALFWVNWGAIAHYPIKWFITGNKSFFPWKS